MCIKNLQILISPWISLRLEKKIIINRIILNSKEVKKGDLFIALKGNYLNGTNFILEALSKGAIAVIKQSHNNYYKLIKYSDNYIPILYLTDLNKHLSAIAGRFYNEPSKKIKIIAVTGTNGKTTITHLISQWINLLGSKTALIGTIGNGVYNNLVDTHCTTDSAIDIQKYLSYFLKKRISFTSIEASSHGLDQNRILSLFLSAVVFTNLTSEHLDYHKNMHHYELSKWKLFSEHKSDKKIINADDQTGYKWLKKLPKAVSVSIKNNFFMQQKKRHFFKVSNIFFHKNHTEIKFQSTWGNDNIIIPLLGQFNVINTILSLATLLSMNFSLKKLIHFSKYLKPIKGRMELYKNFFTPYIIIDYAHTPDALKNALKSCRIYCKENLWCIFGCGGNRDYDKRAKMGDIASKYSDRIIITDDNPRYEKSKKIINDILMGIKNTHIKKIKIISQRSKAIYYAMENAKLDDWILIAGKGHEKYQIIKNRYLNYSDKIIVNEYLRKKID